MISVFKILSIICKPNKVSTQRPFRRKINQENIDLFVKELNTSLNSPEMLCDSNLDSLITVLYFSAFAFALWYPFFVRFRPFFYVFASP